MTGRRHGEAEATSDELLSVWAGDDPELGLVAADPVAWEAAHPCDCEALCVCE